MESKPSDASRALAFSKKGSRIMKSRVGGNKLKHKPSSYGIALKWLIYVRGMTYEDFGKRYNGSTAQNINHLINRVKKKDFNSEDLIKMCDTLGVSYEYFSNLCEEIERLMKVKNG